MIHLEGKYAALAWDLYNCLPQSLLNCGISYCTSYYSRTWRYMKMEVNQGEAEACNSSTDISNTCVSHFSYFAYNLRNSILACKYLMETDPLLSLQYFNSINAQTWLLTWWCSCLASIKRTSLVCIIWAGVTLQTFQQKNKQTLLHMKTEFSIQWSLVWMQTDYITNCRVTCIW